MGTQRAAKSKELRTLTDEEIAKLIARYASWPETRVREEIALALSHKSAKNYGNLYLYVNNWLRKDYERNGNKQGGLSDARPRKFGEHTQEEYERDAAEEREWYGKRSAP